MIQKLKFWVLPKTHYGMKIQPTEEDLAQLLMTNDFGVKVESVEKVSGKVSC
jgi:hypothetical protein